MIVVAPVFFSAAIYLSLSIITASDVRAAASLPFGLKPRAILATFVTVDAVTTVLQVAGAALIGVGYSRIADGQTPPLTPDNANKILTAGLAVQTCFFGIFIALFTSFCVKGWRKYKWHSPDMMLLASITVASLLLWMRIIL